MVGTESTNVLCLPYLCCLCGCAVHMGDQQVAVQSSLTQEALELVSQGHWTRAASPDADLHSV